MKKRQFILPKYVLTFVHQILKYSQNKVMILCIHYIFFSCLYGISLGKDNGILIINDYAKIGRKAANEKLIY